MDAARIRFLVRPDAWAAWEALKLPDGTLEAAYAEYGDERLVAAYVLETVCSDTRQKAAREAVAVGQQTKSYEAAGEWKEEFFSPAVPAESVAADIWCRRAAELRAEVDAEQRTARLPRSTSVAVVVDS